MADRCEKKREYQVYCRYRGFGGRESAVSYILRRDILRVSYAYSSPYFPVAPQRLGH